MLKNPPEYVNDREEFHNLEVDVGNRCSRKRLHSHAKGMMKLIGSAIHTTLIRAYFGSAVPHGRLGAKRLLKPKIWVLVLLDPAQLKAQGSSPSCEGPKPN